MYVLLIELTMMEYQTLTIHFVGGFSLGPVFSPVFL